MNGISDNIFASIYTSLFSREWNGNAIWQHIASGKLTAATCLVGEQYSTQDTKVMIVGRAVNGWQEDFGDCSTLEATVDSVITQNNCLNKFASKSTEDENGNIYYYAKSPFLRMMRQLVGKFTGYEENWQQRLVWSNLYKISFREGGNPSWLMLRDDISLYRDLIISEIRQNEPDVVVFVTDENFFDPYKGNKKYSSFREIMNETGTNNVKSKFICFAGSFIENQNIKLIVCKRPERRPIAEMVDAIADVYNELKK